MKINVNAPVIQIDIKLNGKNGSYTVSAILDTGSTFTIIPKDLAQKLGYDINSTNEYVNITTASGIEIIPVIKLNSIGVLGMEKFNIRVGCHDLPPQATINALLGLDFLRDYITTIDMKYGNLSIKS